MNKIILILGLFLSFGSWSQTPDPSVALPKKRGLADYQAKPPSENVADYTPKSCAPPCPASFSDGGGFCIKPSIKFRTENYGDEKKCEAANAQGACEQCAMHWYKKCEEGFKAISCTICAPQCPKDMEDHGICMKKLPAGCKI